MLWEKEISSCFDFTEDESGEKVVLAKCKICSKHVEKIKNRYQWKLVADVLAYGVEGTRHILKANLRRHTESEGHRRCVVMVTGQPLCKKQKTIPAAFGNAKMMAKASLKPLLIASLYIGRTEKPYSEFPQILEVCGEMGLKLTSAFANDKAAKVFNHAIADQMVDDLRTLVS